MIARVLETWKIQPLWNKLESLFVKAARQLNGYYGPDDILTGLETGTMQMAVVLDESAKAFTAMVVTQPIDTPKKRVLRVIMMSAEHGADLEPLDSEIDAIALREDCDEISALCRPGLAQKLRKRGWKQTGMLMRKETTQAPDQTVH